MVAHKTMKNCLSKENIPVCEPGFSDIVCYFKEIIITFRYTFILCYVKVRLSEIQRVETCEKCIQV